MITSLDVAKYVVAFSESKGDLLTNKKLQKLLYYIQAWHLVNFEGDPFFEEQPQAWVHGPVYPSVYEHFRQYGYQPVSLQKEYDEAGLSSEKYTSYLAMQAGVNERQERLIGSIMLRYGNFSAFALERLSHSETPWLEQRQGLSDIERCTNPISFDSMRQYYNGLKRGAAV